MSNRLRGFFLAALVGAAFLYSGSVVADPTKSQGGTKAIFVKMMHGDEVTLARNGSLEIFARCDLLADTTQLTIFHTSSEAGWYLGSIGPLGADEELSATSIGTGSEAGEYQGRNVGGQASFLPGRFFLGPLFLGMGVRKLDSDCVVDAKFSSS